MAHGALDGKSRKIAYFRSLYDVSSFMLEGAGSVNLRQKDGSIENVLLNFAGTNGRPNNMIGDVLKCENKKIEGSFATYYAHHPDEAYRDTVHYNPSTVFYQRGASYEGVDHIPITPNASIATDPTSIPTGTITLLNVPATSACKTGSSMAVAQDIGGRIKGPHIDVYTGAAPAPEQRQILLTIWDLFLWRFPRGPGVRSQIVYQKPPIEGARARVSRSDTNRHLRLQNRKRPPLSPLLVRSFVTVGI
jgi:membrane-bound lytic murein transglycosylase